MSDARMDDIARDFAGKIARDDVEIYNEFSLQHELGIHLRTVMPDFKVQFERNVSFFFGRPHTFIKKEVDIVVLSSDRAKLHSAIEVKYPRSGQYPEQMFAFCRDIAFAEQLKLAGFASTYFLAFADDRLFYEGSSDGIYGFFRSSIPLSGTIRKPAGSSSESITLQGAYLIRWTTIKNTLKYTLVSI